MGSLARTAGGKPHHLICRHVTRLRNASSGPTDLISDVTLFTYNLLRRNADLWKHRGIFIRSNLLINCPPCTYTVPILPELRKQFACSECTKIFYRQSSACSQVMLITYSSNKFTNRTTYSSFQKQTPAHDPMTSYLIVLTFNSS